MDIRSLLAASLTALAVAGCAGDGATSPNQNDAEAAEFERVAAELGIVAGGGNPLPYEIGAAALRGGARLSKVQIAVGGVTEEWHAFGHEIELELPPELTDPGLGSPPPVRALLAWRSSPSGFRVIHMLSADESGPLGWLIPFPGGDETSTIPPWLTVPSSLFYAEGRDLFWQAASGEQTSRLTGTGAACPVPQRRASNLAPPPSCSHATFSFGFSNVEARPFVLLFGPGASSTPASATRTLSMSAQTVTGVKLKATLVAFTLPPIAARAVP